MQVLGHLVLIAEHESFLQLHLELVFNLIRQGLVCVELLNVEELSDLHRFDVELADRGFRVNLISAGDRALIDIA